jgi:hypothetical protein
MMAGEGQIFGLTSGMARTRKGTTRCEKKLPMNALYSCIMGDLTVDGMLNVKRENGCQQ